MDAVYSVGRFQPPTIGHAAMIQALVATGKPAFVFVSSSQSPAAKNPLTSAEKVAFLRKMFPSGVTFVDTATCRPPCGGPVAAREYLVARGYTTLTLVGGSDREADFGPSARIWEALTAEGETPPAFQSLTRDATDMSSSGAAGTMSGTKARKFVQEGARDAFRAAVTLGSVTEADADGLFDLLAKRLEGPPAKRQRTGGADDESLFEADKETEGGRRRKTRRRRTTRKTRRSKASDRA